MALAIYIAAHAIGHYEKSRAFHLSPAKRGTALGRRIWCSPASTFTGEMNRVRSHWNQGLASRYHSLRAHISVSGNPVSGRLASR